ncbi:MAG: S41 family peptidase [Rhodoferax sp.]
MTPVNHGYSAFVPIRILAVSYPSKKTRNLAIALRQFLQLLVHLSAQHTVVVFALVLPLPAWSQSSGNSDEVVREILSGLEAIESDYYETIPWSTLTAACFSAVGAIPPAPVQEPADRLLQQDVLSAGLRILDPTLSDKARASIGQALAVGQAQARRNRAIATSIGALRGQLSESEYMQTPARCLRAVIALLNPSARYYDRREEIKQAQGTASVGLTLGPDVQGARVSYVTVGAPADRAGIKAGEILTHVDSNPISGLPLEKIISLLRAEQGSKVRLTVQSPGDAPRTLSAIREIVKNQPTVRQIEPGVAVVHMLQINEYAARGICTELVQMRASNGSPLRAIIFDFRDNTGGLFTETVTIANAFLPDTKLVVEARPRDPGRAVKYPSSTGRDTPEKTCKQLPAEAKTVPMAMLVGSRTAAGAEVIAAAWQDHQRAVIIGEQTAGIGNQDQFRSIGTYSGLRFTTAYLFRPNGAAIHGVGVTPDLRIPLESAPQPTSSSEHHGDRALEEALRLVRPQ